MELTKVKGWSTAKKNELNAKGITTIEEILTIPTPQYADIIDVDNETARNHFKLAKEAYDKEHKITSIFKSGKQCDEEDKNMEKITTGCKALDKLFMGGIEYGATTEIYGEFGCGKTQFAHTMAVRIITEKKKKCIWLNTEGTFEPTRIRAICEGMGADADMVLDNILVADAMNSVDQQNILLEIQKLLVEEPDYKLIVVDSATGLFRGDYSGRGQLSERQKYLDQFLTLCSNISKIHNLAVIWTNQVYKDPSVFYGDPTVPVGGTIVAHKSTYRVYFMKSGKFRIAKMVDSPKEAETEVMFGLSSSGVVDMDVAVKEQKELKAKIAKAKTEAKKGKIEVGSRSMVESTGDDEKPATSREE